MIVEAPPTMSITNARNAFLGLIYDYRWRRYIEPGPKNDPYRPIVVDLSKVKELELDAALVLVAEYHRGLVLMPRNIAMIDDENWPREIRDVLRMLGFYDLVRATGNVPDEIPRTASQIRFVKFQSDQLTEPGVAGKLLEALKAAVGPTTAYEYIFAAMIEAIANVRNHGYPEDMPAQVYPIVPRWWAAGAYDPATNVLEFSVYDQGVGIPATLPKRPFFAAIRRFCPPEWNDSDVIVGGLRFSRTRHISNLRRLHKGEPVQSDAGRGNGLWTICSFLSELPGSSVRILSGCGDVTYFDRKNIRKKEHLNEFCGTLLLWKLKLPPIPTEELVAA